MSEALKFIDLFAGIGGIRIPFDELECKCVFSSEIDGYAQRMYEANFGEKPQGDITTIPSSEIPDHDILLAGFPCQAFSIIGKGLGFDDTRGTMFFEVERILRDKRPEAFLLENVKQLVSHDHKRTFKTILINLERLGYNVQWKVLNSMKYGTPVALPQNRERVIIVGFKTNRPFIFPKPASDRIQLKDIIEDHSKVDKKYFVSERILCKRIERTNGKRIPKPSIWHENISGNIGVHEFSCALRAGASHNYLLVDGIRRLTPREQLLLQGFPKDFKIVVTDTQIKKLAGNSVPVPLIRTVAQEMIKAIGTKELHPSLKMQNGKPQSILRTVNTD